MLLKKLIAKAFNLPTPLGERCRRRGAALAEASRDVAREEVLVCCGGSAAGNAERARAAELVLRDNKLHLAELAAGRNERLAHVAEEADSRGKTAPAVASVASVVALDEAQPDAEAAVVEEVVVEKPTAKTAKAAKPK